jgi:hypothetical protein
MNTHTNEEEVRKHTNLVLLYFSKNPQFTK